MVGFFVGLVNLEKINFDSGGCDRPAATGAMLEVDWLHHNLIISNPRIRLAEDYIDKMRAKPEIRKIRSRNTRMDEYPEPLSKCPGIEHIEYASPTSLYAFT